MSLSKYTPDFPVPRALLGVTEIRNIVYLIVLLII
jgi:hypothetical protein